MRPLGPTRHPRLNEAAALVYLAAAIFLLVSLTTYFPADPSWNTATSVEARVHNRMGRTGAYAADALLQLFGLTALAFPVLLGLLAWKWFRSEEIEVPVVKVFGFTVILGCLSASFGMMTSWEPFGWPIRAGGVTGVLVSDYLLVSFNFGGALLLTVTAFLVSLYLVSAFSLSRLYGWLNGPITWWQARVEGWRRWRAERAKRKLEKLKAKKQERRAAKTVAAAAGAGAVVTQTASAVSNAEAPPFDPDPEETAPVEESEEIPIRTLEDEMPRPAPAAPMPVFDARPEEVLSRKPMPPPPASRKTVFQLPGTDLLNDIPPRGGYDTQELKEIAVRIKSKFEEFHVLGSVVQINPGPVVTTFEFKPDAGIKVSRIITLTEDLCLGLQAESVLIERIPGKPTVGIEVPNSRREVISLRQILESEEFLGSASRLTICLGKDINGRIRVASLESMPHLLIAGSTGSGKSVMLNSLIMSVIYKATPEEVRMILVDPKRVEMGIYEGIPHLLTPVITDAKKATYALRNAVQEMERRLKLLAAHGVRNIDQFNKKIKQMKAQPRNLFEETEGDEEELGPLPYILIVIDELADLMMLERAGVEESVTRLAQMARAVGMHLVLATQRPSVDVITGLIKANFPSRISFRVATRVDSRTVLDVMGAEHLLGKGDMLYLPPGSSRLTRVHGAFVTETEINAVVEFWKSQAQPDYDQTFLLAPPSDEEEEGEDDLGPEDPMYEEAVRVVLEMGKASTSILQRRLRLGYGRAARILDHMQRDGIIGPPDGSRPRDVLKRPDWLEEVEESEV